MTKNSRHFLLVLGLALLGAYSLLTGLWPDAMWMSPRVQSLTAGQRMAVGILMLLVSVMTLRWWVKEMRSDPVKDKPIGIGSPLAGTPSLATVRTDRVYGGSAGKVGEASLAACRT
jgi:hypothetical protein